MSSEDQSGEMEQAETPQREAMPTQVTIERDDAGRFEKAIRALLAGDTVQIVYGSEGDYKDLTIAPDGGGVVNTNDMEGAGQRLLQGTHFEENGGDPADNNFPLIKSALEHIRSKNITEYDTSLPAGVAEYLELQRNMREEPWKYDN